MSWWRQVRERATAGAEAVLLAHQLVEQGVDEAEAVARLRAVRGGLPALHHAAEVMAKNADSGYPASEEYRLLRGAAGDRLPAPTAEVAAAEARQRQLREQPSDLSFQQLAEQVPGLLDLERRAVSEPDSFLRELTFRESGMIGRTPPRNPRDRQIRVVMGIDKAVRRLLGPSSGLSDPVLASPAAMQAAVSHLRQAAGIDPRQWREPHPGN